MKRYLAVLKRHPPSAPPMDGWMDGDGRNKTFKNHQKSGN